VKNKEASNRNYHATRSLSTLNEHHDQELEFQQRKIQLFAGLWSNDC